jgi:6-phosphogluconolactonase
VISSPDGRFVYVADLGMDRIVAYRLSPAGTVEPYPEGDFQVAPGLGPRHLVFHPGGRSLYLVCELIATVIGFAVDHDGRLTQRDAFAIAPTSDRIVQPSGIVMSADGRFLFVALRVHNEILGLAIDPATGTLSQTGRWPSGGATPRDLTLSPSGRHLIVANQDSDLLSVFRVDQQRGTLSGPVAQQPVGTPMAITLAEFSAG